jgi:hypothetical protein
MPSISLTRQQLYDRAWTTPLDSLAKELGISGRGLGKLRDRHNIPVPPRGWWAKKAAGHRVERTPLPPATLGAAPSCKLQGVKPNARAASFRRSSPVSRRRRLPTCRRKTRFSSIRYANSSRSRRSSQRVTVSSNIWKAETSITAGSLHDPDFAWQQRGRGVGHYDLFLRKSSPAISKVRSDHTAPTTRHGRPLALSRLVEWRDRRDNALAGCSLNLNVKPTSLRHRHANGRATGYENPATFSRRIRRLLRSTGSGPRIPSQNEWATNDW